RARGAGAGAGGDEGQQGGGGAGPRAGPQHLPQPHEEARPQLIRHRTMGMKSFPLVLVCLLLPSPVCPAADGRAAPLVARIKAVGKEGAGNSDAARAWRELVQLGPAALFDVLAGIDTDAVSANWLRSAVDAIAERELNAGRALPVKGLEAFVTDTKHSGVA